ncbi:MAG: cation:proton antiporter, partial [Bacteroidales bacterium]|nr:cation:proton antiporter [Bacteroidales bacterium]
MLGQVAKLVAYLMFWFVAGLTLIPSLLKKCREHLNDETMTIVALGLCLGMVLIAKMAGFSEALGAFVMGSILSETVECERIEKLMSPIKNLFGAIFFVSVGMMISPATLAEYWLPILVITLTVIFGQIIFATLGITLSGQPMKLAMQSAFALTQVGEFAFIIAQFGESIGVTEKFLYPVVVAVSVITTFLTPYTIRLSEPAYKMLERVLPKRFFDFVGRLSQGKSTIAQQSILRQLLKKVGLTVAVYSVVSIFVITLYQQFVSSWIVDAVKAVTPDNLEWVSRLVAMVVLLIILSPFIYKMVASHKSAPETLALSRDNSYRRATLVALYAARMILAMVFITFCIGQYFNLTLGVLVVSAIAIVIVILLSSKVHKQSSDIEQHFIDNLSAREREQENNRSVRREVEAAFLNYDLHLADFELNPQSLYCGHQLLNLDLRRSCGVNIVRIVRGGVNINAPGGRERLYPHDRIVVAGSDEQIRRFRKELDTAVHTGKEKQSAGRTSTFSLEQLQVSPDMPFCGKTLAESRIGEMAQCVVLGIEHDGEISMNPEADEILWQGDTLILAGETEKIKKLLV